MTDGTGTTAYSYYAVSSSQFGAGQLSTIDGPLTNDTIAYTYDELGRVATRAINAVSQSSTYDALGRVTGVTNVLGSFGYAYVGNSGRLAGVTYPNSQASTYSYFGHTGDDRLQTIHHKYPNSATLSKFDYTYDTVGNIVSWTRQADSNAPTAYQFAYDAADQRRAIPSFCGATFRSARCVTIVVGLLRNGILRKACKITDPATSKRVIISEVAGS